MISHSSIVKARPLMLDRISRVLLIQLGDIGDVVLTTGGITALHQAFPRWRISIAVREKARELMEDCPFIDEVLVADKPSGPFRERLISAARPIYVCRRAGFDLAIDFRTGTRGAFLALLSGASQRISFFSDDGASWRNWAFTHLAEIPYEIGTYVGDYYHGILKVFDLSPASGSPRLWVNPVRQARVDKLCRLSGFDPLAPFIALQPFSLWPYKELPDSLYVELIERMSKTCGMPVVITGGPGERSRGDAISRRCRHQPVNLAGQTSIGEMAALLSRSRLFIGIDSAGLHIAAAVGRPTVGIFGPSAPASWAPRGERHRAVQPSGSCVPCRDKGCRNSGISLCLQRMPVDIILSAAAELLQ
jgi:ADP-heptose:LPS heptosyltransferase